MLKKMWSNLQKIGAMMGPEKSELPHRSMPELHACPHCGSGMSRLRLINGGILPHGAQRRVRASIGCRRCNRQHLLKGDTLYEVRVVLMLLKGNRGGRYWLSADGGVR
jgi:hypothetical protein